MLARGGILARGGVLCEEACLRGIGLLLRVCLLSGVLGWRRVGLVVACGAFGVRGDGTTAGAPAAPLLGSSS